MDHTPLESFFNDDEPELTQEAAPETPEPAPAQPRDETGRFAPKETGEQERAEQPDPEVPPTSQGLPPETFKGLKEEREKRQKLEQELAALKQQIEASQPKEPPAPPPSLWEDEQGWQQHFAAQVTQQANLNATLNLSEMLARREKPDFDQMKDKFLQMAQMNPAIAQQALSDPDPWGKAYQIAKNAATMEELGATDLEALKAKLREELLAEAAATVPVNSAPVIPQSLATARNVAPRTGPAWTGPKSLDELLG